LRTFKGLHAAKIEREQLSAEIKELMAKNNVKNEFIEREITENGSKYLDLESLKHQLITRG
jgi:EAL domain-containing protein (putative c-di-GMP-specific phosphodiesterase class I)